MKVAFSVWKKRIAPVFDVSRRILIFDIDKNNSVTGTYEDFFLHNDPFSRIRVLTAQNIDVLVCGGISIQISDILNRQGIKIISFVSGDIDDVFKAFLNNTLPIP